MSRIVRTGQDLRDQALTSPAPEQHLIQGCTLDLTTRFVGDWRGSDFINNTGAADWSQADTYAAYWRGNRNLEGSLWPANIGPLHHEPVAEIIRQGIATRLPNDLRTIGEDIPAFVLSDYTFASWDTAWDASIRHVTGATKRRFIKMMRLVCVGYPNLLDRVDQLEAALVQGEGRLWTGNAPLKSTLIWPDGAQVIIEPMNLLAEPSRYALARWAEAKADSQQPGSHHCFVFSILPPGALPMASADHWHEDTGRRLGY